MSWHRGRLAAFDVETTGINVESDRIVTAAVSLVGAEEETVSTEWLIDPGIEIPPQATAVHGISTEQARRDGRPAPEAIEEIVTLLAESCHEGFPIIAFNARFDLTFLDREARRYDIEPLTDRIGGVEMLRVVDPLIVDKQVDRYRRGPRKLQTVCEYYGITLDDAHTAGADAIAAARVAWRLGESIAELQGMDLDTLHNLQIEWAAEQAASLQEYFRSQGRSERVEGRWPLIPYTGAAVLAAD